MSKSEGIKPIRRYVTMEQSKAYFEEMSKMCNDERVKALEQQLEQATRVIEKLNAEKEQAYAAGLAAGSFDKAHEVANAFEAGKQDVLRRMPNDEELKAWAVNDHPTSGKGRPGYKQTAEMLRKRLGKVL